MRGFGRSRLQGLGYPLGGSWIVISRVIRGLGFV